MLSSCASLGIMSAYLGRTQDNGAAHAAAPAGARGAHAAHASTGAATCCSACTPTLSHAWGLEGTAAGVAVLQFVQAAALPFGQRCAACAPSKAQPRARRVGLARLPQRQARVQKAACASHCIDL